MRTLLMFVRSPLLRRGWKRSQYNWFFPIIPRQILLPACRDTRFMRPLHQIMRPRPALRKGGAPNCMRTLLMFVRSPLLRRGRGRSQYNPFSTIITVKIIRSGFAFGCQKCYLCMEGKSMMAFPFFVNSCNGWLKWVKFPAHISHVAC